MKQTKMFCALVLLLSLVVSGGCSSDPAERDPVVEDMGSDDGATPEPDMGGAPTDMGVSDMPAPEDMRPGDEDTGGADAGDDEDLGGDDAGVDDTGVPDEPCAYPTTDPNCPMGPYGPGTFLDKVFVPSGNSCCFDYNGDGNDDNKVGSYLSLASAAAGGDLNQNIQQFIDAGFLVYLFEYSNWSNERDDAELDIRFMTGSDSDQDFTDNLLGTGEFNVDASSFNPDGTPRWSFAAASVTNGVMEASGGNIQLTFPGLLDQVLLEVIDVRFRADVGSPVDLTAGGGAGLENGELGGVLERDPFYESLNAAAVNCDCIGQDLFLYDAGSDSYTCETTAALETSCNDDPNASEGCKTLASQFVCGALENVSTDMDVDTDGDGSNDAYSLAIEFTGVAASLVGTNP